ASVSPPPGAPPGGPAESTPRASPLTTLKPRAATSAARRPATSSAYGDAAREPTMATAGRSNAASDPRVQMAGGGSMIAESGGGYPGSLQTSDVRPLAAA